MDTPDNEYRMPQPFLLVRDEDATGVSGTGPIAQGVIFKDGTCAMRWTTKTASTCIYDSVDDVLAIHGHNGKTRIVKPEEGGLAASKENLCSR
jgi:hypothetical protein